MVTRITDKINVGTKAFLCCHKFMQSTRQIIGTLGLFISATLVADPISLFDGKTLKGWEGDPTVWRVDLTNECIVGGSTERTQ